MDEQQTTRIEKALKRLTLAVWVLAIALLIMTVPTLLMFVAPGVMINSIAGTKMNFEDYSVGGEGYSFPTDFSDEPDFWEMSIEEKIENASVIAVTRYEQSEDGMTKSIITEILKQEPGTKSKYQAGDEFAQGSFYPGADRGRGDGQVIFFAGNPASFQYFTSYEGERIPGLADIPMKLFRGKCGKE